MNWYIASYSRKQGEPPYYLNFAAESIEKAREEAQRRIANENQIGRAVFDAKIKRQNEEEWKSLEAEVKLAPSISQQSS